jgi:hypothetical protein
MSNAIQIRESHSKPQKLSCQICGSAVDIERHHPGGRNHLPWSTIPLCRKHHVRVTAMIRGAGIDMRYTPNKRVRIVRALMTIVVLIWILLKQLLQEFEQERKQDNEA